MWIRMNGYIWYILLAIFFKSLPNCSATTSAATAAATNQYSQYNLLNLDVNGPRPSVVAATDDWQPLPTHSNWIIVQSSPPQQASKVSAIAASSNPVNHFIRARKQQQYAAPPQIYASGKRRPFENGGTSTSSSSSLSFYTYEGSSLNQQSPKKNHSFVVPPKPNNKSKMNIPGEYITNMNPRKDDEHLRPPRHSAAVLSSGEKADTNRPLKNDIDNIPDALDADDTETDWDDIADDGEHFDELLLPLQSAVERVRDFCDVLQGMISQVTSTEIIDEKNDGTEILGRSATTSATPTTNTAAHLPATQQLSSFIGSARKGSKIKKKLKKLLLPLLIAYKLKFMALIPVLIGGLTLLVGTTGMAGFFFALFTAVMSLKGSGGTKSIVVKKI